MIVETCQLVPLKDLRPRNPRRGSQWERRATDSVCLGQVGPCLSDHCPGSAPWPAACNLRYEDTPCPQLTLRVLTEHIRHPYLFWVTATSGMCWLVLTWLIIFRLAFPASSDNV